jgi:hypothetical protein
MRGVVKQQGRRVTTNSILVPSLWHVGSARPRVYLLLASGCRPSCGQAQSRFYSAPTKSLQAQKPQMEAAGAAARRAPAAETLLARVTYISAS